MRGDEDPLLDDELEARRTESQAKPAAVAQLFLLPELRKPLMVVCLAMLTQQVSGTVISILYVKILLTSISGINAGSCFDILHRLPLNSKKKFKCSTIAMRSCRNPFLNGDPMFPLESQL